jgi:hypothetical protein
MTIIYPDNGPKESTIITTFTSCVAGSDELCSTQREDLSYLLQPRATRSQSQCVVAVAAA